MLFVNVASGTNLGIHGHIFPVEEESLLEHLKKKISLMPKTSLESFEKQVKKNYLHMINEPNAVSGLGEANEYHVSFFDPTISLSHDITDHENNIVIAKGTAINPLSISSFGTEFIFLDGTNDVHIEWAKTQKANSKWILVKGKPLELEERVKRPVYFDQFGALTQKFGIHQVPAKVSQDGLRLKIEEIPLRERV